MNLFERIATGVQVALGRKQLTTTTKAYDPFLVVTNRSLQQGDAEITSPYSQSPWVYAGVRAIGRYVASTPCIVKRGTKRTREGQPVPSDDPWQLSNRLLRATTSATTPGADGELIGDAREAQAQARQLSEELRTTWVGCRGAGCP